VQINGLCIPHDCEFPAHRKGQFPTTYESVHYVSGIEVVFIVLLFCTCMYVCMSLRIQEAQLSQRDHTTRCVTL